MRTSNNSKSLNCIRTRTFCVRRFVSYFFFQFFPFDCNRFLFSFSFVLKERLSEAQTRLAAAEAEVAQLKERLARCEGAEVDGRQVIQQLEADKSSMAASHEQQRLVFDKCLDEIANHVVQALISQKVRRPRPPSTDAE